MTCSKSVLLIFYPTCITQSLGVSFDDCLQLEGYQYYEKMSLTYTYLNVMLVLGNTFTLSVKVSQ